MCIRDSRCAAQAPLRPPDELRHRLSFSTAVVGCVVRTNGCSAGIPGVHGAPYVISSHTTTGLRARCCLSLADDRSHHSPASGHAAVAHGSCLAYCLLRWPGFQRAAASARRLGETRGAARAVRHSYPSWPATGGRCLAGALRAGLRAAGYSPGHRQGCLLYTSRCV